MKIPLWNRIEDRIARKVIEKRYSLADLDKSMDAAFAVSTATGVNVNENSALNYPVVFSCVRILAETVAMLPLIEYRRLDKGKERATGHYLYSILHDAPNPEMTSFTFRETLQGHLGTWGNAYAEIQWGRDGEVVALWPLRPDKMKDIIRKDGKLWYQYRLPDKYGQDVLLPAYRVLHIPFMGYNGVAGYSPISMAREAIGMGLAMQEYGARFFGNGAQLSGVIKGPPGATMSPDSKKLLRETWQEAHQGLMNAWRTAILEDGFEFQQIGVPPEEAQFLQSRDFQKGEIAAWYRIPPHMVGVKEVSQTYANIESQGINFVTFTMLPWLRRWETILNQKLLLGSDQEQYFIEFNVNGLMRGDSAARAAYYNSLFNIGVLSQDEIREIENMNPIDGDQGNKHWIGLNLQPIEDYKPRAEAAPVQQPKQIASAFEPVFRQAAQEIVEKELRDIERARKRPEFNQWARDYYNTMPEAIERRMTAPLDALAEMHGVTSVGTVKAHIAAVSRDYANANRSALEAGNQIDTKEAIDRLANRCRDLPAA